MRRFPKEKVQVSAGAWITAAALILLLPLPWLLAAFFAAVFHEGCHYIALWLCGSKPVGFGIGSRGAVLEAPTMSRGRELVCALAGPLGGFVLAAFYRYVPRVAVCALTQSLFNLIPIYPLDGGRVLSCAAALILPPKWAKRVVSFALWGSFAALFALGIYGWLVLRLGFFSMLPWAALALRKNPLQTGPKKSTIEELTV